MKAIYVYGAVVAAFLALWVPLAQADEAAQMYDPSTVDAIELTLPQASQEALEAEPPSADYVEGFLTLRETAGTPGSEGSPVINAMKVGIRLKGNVGGSFRPLKTGKAAFKIKCNFVKGEKCLGLKKMTLNNMVQDPSMLHETLAYASFRAAGVPASRTGFAYVKVNGKDFGLYLNLETLDDVSLKRLFGSFDDETQHLYEGEQGDDVFPGGEVGFEVDEGSKVDISDLEALIKATNEGGTEPFSSRVGSYADVTEMTKMWAVEKYIDHWDGYAGHTDPAQAGERPNNYYLYSDPTGRFQMLPWGTDQAWIPTIDVETSGREVTFDGPGGILFNKCLEDEECFRAYWKALRDATDAIAVLDPHGLAEDTADLLAPWQTKEIADGRSEYDATEIKEDKYGVDTTLAFIAGRRAEAEEWLAAHKPVEPVVPNPTVNPGNSGPTPPSNPAQPGLLFERAKRSGHRLTIHVQVPGPGKVTLRATFKAGKKRKQACSTDKRAQAAGPFTLRCILSGPALERLASGPLRLKLTVTTAGGAVVQRVRLPRS
jgi:spore coat protein CotH